ncbi:MAG: hypothetical protein ACD_79C00424G0001, partial [uncultured bacterium]
MPDNIGVGDKLTYGGNIAYIYQRVSPTQYYIQSATGGLATNTAAGTACTVLRAYNSVNSALEVGVADGSHLNTNNLVTGNIQLNLACYADGIDTARLNTWYFTTGINSYIRVFTPYLLSEVGISQRHSGVWTTNAYRLEVSATADLASSVGSSCPYTRIEGLQISFNNTGFTGGYGIVVGSVVYIESNIIKGGTAATAAYGIFSGDGSYNARIVNNIIYGFENYGIYSKWYCTPIVYNNTVSNCGIGIGSASGNLIAKNNIVQACTTGYSSSFYSSSDYNLSSDATAPGANSKQTATVQFEDSANKDFRI